MWLDLRMFCLECGTAYSAGFCCSRDWRVFFLSGARWFHLFLTIGFSAALRGRCHEDFIYCYYLTLQTCKLDIVTRFSFPDLPL